MNELDTIVIIGGGHAAAQLCAGLAEAGQGARVHLVCEEPELPYQRPPLSKAFLKSPQEPIEEHRALTAATRRPCGASRFHPEHDRSSRPVKIRVCRHHHLGRGGK